MGDLDDHAPDGYYDGWRYDELRNESGLPECYCMAFPIAPHSHLTTDGKSSNIKPDTN